MSASTPLPLRVAIIGAGQVADKVHASYYATRSDVQMVAVMDSRLEQAQAFAERYAIPSAWQDAHEMLQEVKPDVVSVCSPNRFHFEHVMAALEAGCHVMCEKPPAITAHSFQRLGNRKHTGQFGEWDPAQFTVEDALFGTIEFCNGGILRLDTSFALNIRELSIINVSFCGEKAGATLFPAHIYNDEAGVLQTLIQREEADDRRHLRSMDAFVRHVLGEPVMIADAEQGLVIQQLVAALYEAAETGESVTLC